MLKLSILLFFLFISTILSQPKSINYSNWLFGHNAGLKFTLDKADPIEILSNIDTLNSDEGICTFSDDEGKIILCSNGKRLVHFYGDPTRGEYKVFNFNLSNRITTSTNNTIILQSISDSNQYYIFITGENWIVSENDKFLYAIFDISLNNGKGDFVVSLTKIRNIYSEKLAAIYDYGLNKYLILTTNTSLFANDPDDSTDLYIYTLDENGLDLNPKVINLKRRYSSIGDLKISPDGKYIAICGYGNQNFGIYKFDILNQEVNEIYYLYEPQSDVYTFNYYSAEFSNDVNKLYLSFSQKSDKLYIRNYITQFDLSLIEDSTKFDLSKKIILQDTLYYAYLKRGLNDKIYISTMSYKSLSPAERNNSLNYLTCIENPEEDANQLNYSDIYFSSHRFPILGLQTTPEILFRDEIEDSNSLCKSDINVYLNDKTLNLGDTFCINGVFNYICIDTLDLSFIELQFEYNPKFMKIISASTGYRIVEGEIMNKLILKFDIEKRDVIEEINFSVCFQSLLNSDKLSDLKVLESEEYNLIDFRNSNIEYLSCDQPFRQVKHFYATEYYYTLSNNIVSIFLTTEEQGDFKFQIFDVLGNMHYSNMLNLTQSQYINDNVLNFPIENYPFGNYFLRMISPSMEIYTKQLIID